MITQIKVFSLLEQCNLLRSVSVKARITKEPSKSPPLWVHDHNQLGVKDDPIAWLCTSTAGCVKLRHHNYSSCYGPQKYLVYRCLQTMFRLEVFSHSNVWLPNGTATWQQCRQGPATPPNEVMVRNGHDKRRTQCQPTWDHGINESESLSLVIGFRSYPDHKSDKSDKPVKSLQWRQWYQLKHLWLHVLIVAHSHGHP